MASVGKATLVIVPSFDGLSAAVDAEMEKLNAKGGQRGAAFGKSYSGGLIKSGAVIGTFSAITNKALASVSSHVSDAVSRFDTLNNYPKVMETMGYSTEAAEASISKMSDRLQGLPTTLDSMVGSTQRLVTTTKDLDKATAGALAVNDMLIAGGANQQLVNSAQEQFMQIISKGKPEMQDWKSLLQAMPGQLDQLAKSLLGPKAGADELYAALGGGKNEQKITMSELLDQVIKLDKEGGEGFASFQEQAETVAGGVATSAANMGNAITRGVTGTMDAIGKENIAGVFNDMKSGINDAFKGINGAVKDAMPVLQGGYDVIKKYGVNIAGGAAAFGLLSSGANAATGHIQTVSARVSTYTKAQASANAEATLGGKVMAGLGGKFNVASIAATAGLGILTAAATLYITRAQEIAKDQENITKSTVGLSDAVSRATGLDKYAEEVGGIGEAGKFSAKSLKELTESTADHVDKMNEIADAAEAETGKLNAAQSIIEKYTGQTDLSAKAQGELKYALKTVNGAFGTHFKMADVASGTYKTQKGKVKDLISEIDKLISKKKEEIQQDALSKQLTEAYENQADAQKTYAAEFVKFQDTKDQKMREADELYSTGKITLEEYNQEVARISTPLENAQKKLDDANKAVDGLNEKLADNEKSSGKSASSIDKWGNKVKDSMSGIIEARGTGASFSDLKRDLEDMGASVKDLNAIAENKDALNDIAYAYDGTMTSIIDVLGRYGVRLSEAGTQTAEAASGIKGSLEGMGAAEVIEGMGMSLNDFSQKMAQSGLDSTALKDMTSENFAELAAACGNDVNQMIFLLQHYNDTPIFDKDGNVQVNDASLIDAQGKVYKWNSTDGLQTLEGDAVIDAVELQDAQGNIVEWNGSTLVRQQGSVDIDSDELQSTLAQMSTWNNTTLKTITGKVSISRDENQGGGKKRKHASGGYRLHADGGIATRATRISDNDIVGEDGAEMWVPLTNRRYSQPLVDLLADGLKERQGPQVVNNYYWNGTRVEDGTRMNRAMKAVAREAELNKRAGG